MEVELSGPYDVGPEMTHSNLILIIYAECRAWLTQNTTSVKIYSKIIKNENP